MRGYLKIAGGMPLGGNMTCEACGKPMRYNAPRLGPNGGFVHLETGSFNCDPIPLTRRAMFEAEDYYVKIKKDFGHKPVFASRMADLEEKWNAAVRILKNLDHHYTDCGGSVTSKCDCTAAEDIKMLFKA